MTIIHTPARHLTRTALLGVVLLGPSAQAIVLKRLPSTILGTVCKLFQAGILDGEDEVVCDAAKVAQDAEKKAQAVLNAVAFGKRGDLAGIGQAIAPIFGGANGLPQVNQEISTLLDGAELSTLAVSMQRVQSMIHATFTQPALAEARNPRMAPLEGLGAGAQQTRQTIYQSPVGGLIASAAAGEQEQVAVKQVNAGMLGAASQRIAQEMVENNESVATARKTKENAEKLNTRAKLAVSTRGTMIVAVDAITQNMKATAASTSQIVTALTNQAQQTALNTQALAMIAQSLMAKDTAEIAAKKQALDEARQAAEREQVKYEAIGKGMRGLFDSVGDTDKIAANLDRFGAP